MVWGEGEVASPVKMDLFACFHGERGIFCAYFLKNADLYMCVCFFFFSKKLGGLLHVFTAYRGHVPQENFER